MPFHDPRWAAPVAFILLTSCQSADSRPAPPRPAMRAFASASQLQAFADKLHRAEAAEQARHKLDAPVMYDVAAAPAPASIDVAAAAPAEANAQITNGQEKGVDEGGIVKVAGDYLVILRRGRLFTVRHAGGALAAVDHVDAFPPGKANAGATWYDEMLVRGDQVVVIGYSYGDAGTEINRFRLSPDGRLRYRDTHYLSSGDYYSSSNYASRLIGDTLVFYAPVPADWSEWRKAMPWLRKRGLGAEGAKEVLVEPGRLYVAEPFRDARRPLEVLHTVTRCDLAAPELHCEASAVAGAWSREFYVARDAVYVWTEGTPRFGGSRRDNSPRRGMLYRLPLDGSAPAAVAVAGGPVDQFSFRQDSAPDTLRVVLRADGGGGAMWSSEVSDGDVALLSLPLSAFGDGSGSAPARSYRPLPKVDGWRFQNRFVGRYLLYSAAGYGDEPAAPFVYAAPLDGGAPRRIALPHGVTRLDALGADAVAIGPARGDALGFSAISLGASARLEDSFLLPSAGEGEVRSQAFYYRPDPGSADQASGTLGLPVARRLTGPAAEFLGSASSIFFLRRNARKLDPAGELAADAVHARDDACVASCVDWYGNARPIFLGDRTFALMGYELVEGRWSRGRIAETRRVNFAPAAKVAERR